MQPESTRAPTSNGFQWNAIAGADAHDGATLSGLPLASSYTVIIDPTIADNRFINWQNLQDVEIRVNYGYQDVSAAGTCD